MLKKSYEESNSFNVLNASMKKYLDKNKKDTINEGEQNGDIFHFNVDNKFLWYLDKPININMNSEKYYVENNLIRCNNKNDINLINNRNDELNLNYVPCNSFINTPNNCLNKYTNNNVNEKKGYFKKYEGTIFLFFQGEQN